MESVFFYILDAFVVGVLFVRALNSQKVTFPTSVGSPKWLALGFVAIGLFNLLFRQDTFNWIQTVAWCAIGGLFYLGKSGLGEEGVYRMGAFTPFTKISNLVAEKDDDHVRLVYTCKGRQQYIFYAESDKEKLNDALLELREKGKI